jgi:hypothetical protein
VLVDAVDERPVEVEQEGLRTIHADMLRAGRAFGDVRGRSFPWRSAVARLTPVS